MDRRRVVTLGVLGAAIGLSAIIFGQSPKAAASFRVPSDANETIETVPDATDPAKKEAAGLRRALAQDPNNLRAATQLARLYIQLARSRSDPRYLGHAQAALAPWWNEEAPPEVLVIRATIEQSLHDFDSALAHLDKAIAKNPHAAQAWLTKAVVLTVIGRYDEARAACKVVDQRIGTLAFTVCDTQIDSLTGDANRARERLAPIVASTELHDPTQLWALSSLAEYALRMGNFGIAEAHFKRVLELDADDAYVRAALADLFIDLGRFDDAIALVEKHEANDSLLLRLAIAEKRAKKPRAEEHIAMLGARFDASRARGDVVHRREESRYWLSLRDDADKALELAKANWEVQKEPWDVRVFVEAARAAKKKDEAKPVVEWLAKTKLEDPFIAQTAWELR